MNDFLHNKGETYRLHKLAEGYSQRPSQFFGITDEWLAFQFDSSVFTWGRYVDNKLDEKELVDKKTGKTRPKWKLEEILSGKANKPKITNLTELFLASPVDRMVLQ